MLAYRVLEESASWNRVKCQHISHSAPLLRTRDQDYSFVPSNPNSRRKNLIIRLRLDDNR
jgi:hypothetical protein